MQNDNIRKSIILIILVVLMPLLASAEDKRSIPLDMYLIIDGSSEFKNLKTGIIAWVNGQVVDRILADGDKISVWSAGDRPELIYSATISGEAGKRSLKEKLETLGTGGGAADFSGALREALPAISQTPRGRLSYTMLITASAEGLEPAFGGSGQNLFKWFRSEKYERWQVLIVAPDIGTKVQQSAAAYMGSLR